MTRLQSSQVQPKNDKVQRILICKILACQKESYLAIPTLQNTFNVTFLLYHSSIHWLFIPRDINNGVYRAGFATKQEAYDTAVKEVFAALDRVEEILSQRRYLTGSQITEADIRLYTTLARFDCVYVGHFKVRVTYFAAVYMCIPGTIFELSLQFS